MLTSPYTFAETFGFPGFYGRNMNAWNDCMTFLDGPDAGSPCGEENREVGGCAAPSKIRRRRGR
ncbi:MAG: barstar family protein [Phycisphaerae bacterium]|nr:barstar family protein [Phycisphaerae bacterium]